MLGVRQFPSKYIRPALRVESAAAMDPVEFARTRLGFEPDERQAAVMRSQTKRGILNCSRQWGKSTVAAAMAVHRAATRPGCEVMVGSPSGRQSGELLRKAEKMVRRMGMRVERDGTNEISIQFKNGSRIVGLPGKEGRIRGFSASLLLFDEAAYMEDETYESLRPLIATTEGDIWMMSTPNGRTGFFYRTWEFGGNEWLKVRGPGTECARISAKFLEEERATLGPVKFPQEYLCEFTEAEGAMFDRVVIERAVDKSVKALDLA